MTGSSRWTAMPADLTVAARASLDRPELAPLWSALRERFESGQPVTRVRVGPLDVDQQTALADLLGLLRLPGEFARVSLEQLDRVLVDMTALESRSVVEILTGPLVDRAAARLADREARDALWNWLDNHPVVRSEPALRDWVARVRRAGVVEGSVPQTRRLLERALAVLGALPADGLPLPAFAESTCGDEHGLDDGRRLSTLVLHALATLYDEPEPANAEHRRQLWERAGVACDTLSTTVLVAGLRPGGDSALAKVLRIWADAGQAGVVTLDQVRVAGALDACASTVWVVENPSVLAMAVARFTTACPPMVCTSGWPNSATILLLRRLREAGAEIRYHGDFDGDGLRIAAYVCSKVGAVPWRMTSRDYLAAATPGGRSPGRVTDVPWDAELGPHVRSLGVAVPEERVATELLDELAAQLIRTGPG
ncbi:TIGR02679 family protein [Actinopolymorpha alba]|uniref:TIGR02679 family protein n=1 Tax=Actinopolymorpha alba TaxID=533267 RepID=UPI00192B5F80|nr:TIGR02679 family protein [Actinopolymorpha alba]